MPSVSKKVCLIGSFGVGKTSLVRNFIHHVFSEEYLTTIGVKIDKKVVMIADTQVTLVLWDIAGEMNMDDIPRNYLLGAHGLIYVFDLTRPSTWANLEDNLSQMNQLLPKAPIVVVGNKKDLLKEGEPALEQQPFSPFTDLYTSAKTGEGVEHLFLQLTHRILAI
jgi:small GTP-binding protein